MGGTGDKRLLETGDGGLRDRAMKRGPAAGWGNRLPQGPGNGLACAGRADELGGGAPSDPQAGRFASPSLKSWALGPAGPA